MPEALAVDWPIPSALPPQAFGSNVEWLLLWAVVGLVAALHLVVRHFLKREESFFAGMKNRDEVSERMADALSENAEVARRLTDRIDNIARQFQCRGR